MNSALKAALLAGLAAGLVMGLFHFLLTEPVMDRAIALEQPGAYTPVVSRGAQKGMLIVGSALYGLIMGVIFALIFAVVGRHLPGRWPDVKTAALAGLLWWSLALLPFLKYPANPPGVGDPETVAFRQGIYLGFIALSALIMAISATSYWLLGKFRRELWLWRWRPGIAAGLYVVLAILLFALMPANPDPITAPAALIWDFRILALSGQVLFWVTLGGASALLLRRFAGRGALGKTG